MKNQESFRSTSKAEYQFRAEAIYLVGLSMGFAFAIFQQKFRDRHEPNWSSRPAIENVRLAI